MKRETQINNHFILYVEDNMVDSMQYNIVKLYQPIIGHKASMLYITLANMDANKKADTFHHLVDVMQIDFQTLYQSFQNLEAMGLITTYTGDAEGANLFIYQINSPLSFADFLKEPLYTKALSYAMGELYVDELVATELQRFEEINKIDELENVSASFQQVFANMMLDIEVDPQLETQKITVEQEPKFMLDTFLMLLPPSVRENIDFNDDLVKLLGKLSSLYDLSTEHMAEAFVTVLQNNHGVFDEELMRKTAYEFGVQILRNKSAEEEDEGNAPKYAIVDQKIKDNNVRKVIFQMKQKTSPEYAKLITHSLTPKDLQVIEKISLDYQLPDEVINVLINFVYHETESINLPYAEAIAQNWNKAKIATAEDAYLALNEFMRKKKQREDKQKTSMQGSNRRTEIVPDFNQSKQVENADLQEEFDKLMEELKGVE